MRKLAVLLLTIGVLLSIKSYGQDSETESKITIMTKQSANSFYLRNYHQTENLYFAPLSLEEGILGTSRFTSINEFIPACPSVMLNGGDQFLATRSYTSTSKFLNRTFQSVYTFDLMGTIVDYEWGFSLGKD